VISPENRLLLHTAAIFTPAVAWSAAFPANAGHFVTVAAVFVL
jgi:hypothetical protein